MCINGRRFLEKAYRIIAVTARLSSEYIYMGYKKL